MILVPLPLAIQKGSFLSPLVVRHGHVTQCGWPMALGGSDVMFPGWPLQTLQFSWMSPLFPYSGKKKRTQRGSQSSWGMGEPLDGRNRPSHTYAYISYTSQAHTSHTGIYHAHTHTGICMHTRVYTYIAYTCVFIHMHISCVYLHACSHIHSHAHLHTHTLTDTYTPASPAAPIRL